MCSGANKIVGTGFLQATRSISWDVKQAAAVPVKTLSCSEGCGTIHWIHGNGSSDLKLGISDPSKHIPRILGVQRQVPSFQIHAVHVKDLWIPFVEPYQNLWTAQNSKTDNRRTAYSRSF